jgi:hypothetical protein
MVWTYEYTLLLFGALGVIIALIGWFWHLRSYNIQVIIRQIVKDRKLILKDWGKMILDENGIEKLRLRWEKVDIPVPDPTAFELDNKGRKFIEIYKYSDLDYAPVKDTGTIEAIKSNIPYYESGKKDNGLFKKKTDVNVMDHSGSTFRPMNTNQRMALANQIRKAIERKRKPWLEVLTQFVPLIVLMIIVVCLLIFWGDMAKPLLDFQTNQLEITKMQKETMTILDAIIYDKQEILFTRFNTTQLNKTVIP